MKIAFAKPYFTGEEAEAVTSVIQSGWVSQGPKVREFEAAFAARVGAVDAVATSSCTTALQMALHVIGVGPGDEVIVPSLSFIATANSVWQCGATPVFADIDPRTYNLDPAAAEAAITSRTKAIMPVHQLGLPAEMDAFADISGRHNLALIEDAACAIGATYKGRKIGSMESMACFSFHPRKVITTGEGGMIAVSDPEVAARLRQLRQHAMDVSDLARHNATAVTIESYPERGFNTRMTDMQAVLGLCQLTILDEVLAERKRLATRYNEALSDSPYLQTPFEPAHVERTWQSYALRLSRDVPLTVIELMNSLLTDGIPTRRGVMAIHHEPAYSGSQVDLPHTDAAANEVIMLPLFAGLSNDEQDYVLERVNYHTKKASK